MEKNAIVLYKNQFAITGESEGDKIHLRFCVHPASSGKKAVFGEQKVRQKDFVLLHKGPCTDFDAALSFFDDNMDSQIKETYELLLSDESTAKEKISLSELAEYARGSFKCEEVCAFYSKVKESLYFEADETEFKCGNLFYFPRSQEDVLLMEKKNYEKEHEQEIKKEFIQRLKERKLKLPDDARFMGEVEAFALCKTEKSKILYEAGIAQSVEKAHKLLIDTGIWDVTKNPYPTRLGFSFDSAKEQLGSMPQEERIEVPGIAYAIDSEHSADPDDAIAFDGQYVWVHIADPACAVWPDSKIDEVARARGCTLYIPEATSRMLCESSLEDYALGLKEVSNALSFRLKLDDDSQISECSVLKTKIKVKRLTYKMAEELKDSKELKPLFEIARKNKARREKNGSVVIQMPEVEIEVSKETKKVSIKPCERFESNDMVAEFMILAGEGAARFAFKKQIPFMYVSQEMPDFPSNVPDSWAGEFARVKCMRKRSVGITPASHAALGLSFYSQVTSPLRRYGDLISHQQLRAFLDGRKLISKDEMLEKVAAGDAASLAARKASRQSELHWKLVYLLQNPEKTFEAFCIDKRGSDALFLIPSLDMQTTLKNIPDVSLNEMFILKMKSLDIPLQTVDFLVIGK